ncbi:FAR1-related protein [Sesbania bispinosa]|nr:FAR1-related protein [Sesbania bispinosa]
MRDEDGGVFVFGDNWGGKEVVDDEGTGDNGFDNDNNDNGSGFFYDENGGRVFFVGPDWKDSNEEGDGDEGFAEIIAISCEDDILNMRDLSLFSPVQIVKYEFASIDVAYKFYLKYAEANGFEKVSMKTVVLRWKIEFVSLDLKLGLVHCKMLRVFRRMSESDVVQMSNMMKKDMYNKINEQRRKLCSDAKGAVEFLGELRLMDRMMYYGHTIDAQGRKWAELVSKFGLEENTWVLGLYEKRAMWATTYFRGKFFAGFRTTSRVEMLVVTDCSQAVRCTIFRVSPKIGRSIECLVSFYQSKELPETLVLKRWFKGAKDGLDGDGNYAWNIESEEAVGGSACNVGNDSLRDLVRAATKGSGVVSFSAGIRVRRKQNCSVCKLTGHNKLTCPTRGTQNQVHQPMDDVRHSHVMEHSDAYNEYRDFDPDSVCLD